MAIFHDLRLRIAVDGDQFRALIERLDELGYVLSHDPLVLSDEGQLIYDARVQELVQVDLG